MKKILLLMLLVFWGGVSCASDSLVKNNQSGVKLPPIALTIDKPIKTMQDQRKAWCADFDKDAPDQALYEQEVARQLRASGTSSPRIHKLAPLSVVNNVESPFVVPTESPSIFPSSSDTPVSCLGQLQQNSPTMHSLQGHSPVPFSPSNKKLVSLPSIVARFVTSPGELKTPILTLNNDGFRGKNDSFTPLTKEQKLELKNEQSEQERNIALHGVCDISLNNTERTAEQLDERRYKYIYKKLSNAGPMVTDKYMNHLRAELKKIKADDISDTSNRS
jgi:hypothetical protein